MSTELKKAQKNLTEGVIRRFWRAMTLSYPSMCVNNGISINYHKHMDIHHVQQMVQQLTKCKNANVATPLFQYEYDPGNATPHHLSAITLTKFPTHYVLSLFDPKGKGSLRPKEEDLLMKILAKSIERQTKKKVNIQIYNGENLQKNDYIGLCQLFSLYYLYEYIIEITKTKSQTMDTLIDPNKMVQHIKTKRGHFNEKTLLHFWCTFFKNIR